MGVGRLRSHVVIATTAALVVAAFYLPEPVGEHEDVRGLSEEFASPEIPDRGRAEELRARWDALRSARGRP